MSFKKFVQIGRVVYVARGENEGKVCSIVDVIDGNRVLVDGPCSGVTRQSLRFKDLHLTKFKVRISNSCRTKYVRKAWEATKIGEKWEQTSWAKRLQAKKTQREMTDFDKFKLMRAKQTRNRIIKARFFKLRKRARKAGEMKLKKRKHDRKKPKKE